MGFLKTLFYFLSAAIFIFNIYYNRTCDGELHRDGLRKAIPIPYWSIYLTQIDVHLCAIYYSINFIKCLCSSSSSCTTTQKCNLQKYLTLFFKAIIAPGSIIVAVYFWAIYLYSPEMMVNPKYANYFPNWFLHTCHTTQIFCITFELLLQEQHSVYKSNSFSVLIFNLIFAIWYCAWSYYAYTLIGKFAYPFLDAAWHSEPYHYAYWLIFVGTTFLFNWLSRGTERVSFRIHGRNGEKKYA